MKWTRSLFDGQGYTACDCKTLGWSTFCSCKKSSKLCNAKGHRYCTENEFFIMDFFIKRNQNRTFLQIWSHLRKKSLMETLIFLTRKRMTCWHIHNMFGISFILFFVSSYHCLMPRKVCFCCLLTYLFMALAYSKTTILLCFLDCIYYWIH